jgi:hypothetical protein
MIIFFISLIISLLLAFGMAIALVEKGDDFPIKFWKDKLKVVLGKVHSRMPEMLECTTCTSFWAALIADIVLCIVNISLFGTFYFFWPFSGIIILGITWYAIEHLNAIDSNGE